MDIEREYFDKIEKGSLTDMDIQAIINHGSRELKNALNKKEATLRKQKSHYALMNDLRDCDFDGVDNEGKPFRDLKINKDVWT